MDAFQNGIALGLLVALGLLALLSVGIGFALYWTTRRLTRLEVGRHEGVVTFSGTVRTREWSWADREIDRVAIKRRIEFENSNTKEGPND